MDPKDVITRARMAIYRLGGIEVYTKDGVFAARAIDNSLESVKNAAAYNALVEQQSKLKAADTDGDYQWDVQP